MEQDQDLNALTVEQITDLFYNVFANRNPNLTIYGYLDGEDSTKQTLKYGINVSISPKKGASFSLEESGPNLKTTLVTAISGIMGLK